MKINTLQRNSVWTEVIITIPSNPYLSHTETIYLLLTLIAVTLRRYIYFKNQMNSVSNSYFIHH